MRKYRNGLSAIVQSGMEKDVFAKALFIFLNRRQNIIRFLYWDDTGFAVWTKALDKQKYKWPINLFEGVSLSITPEKLGFILQGMDITSHKKLEYKKLF